MTNSQYNEETICTKGVKVGERYWHLFFQEEAGMSWMASSCEEAMAHPYGHEEVDVNHVAMIRHYLMHLDRESRFFIRTKPVYALIQQAVRQAGVQSRDRLLQHDFSEEQLFLILKTYLCQDTKLILYIISEFGALQKYTTSSTQYSKRDSRVYIKNLVSQNPTEVHGQLISEYLYEDDFHMREYINNDQLCDRLDDLSMLLRNPYHVASSLRQQIETTNTGTDTILLDSLNWIIQHATLLNSLTDIQMKNLIHDQFGTHD